jgi:hypothetical protein
MGKLTDKQFVDAVSKDFEAYRTKLRHNETRWHEEQRRREKFKQPGVRTELKKDQER